MHHVVVDGSNIATEGRTAPSLAQLDEAVRAFLDTYGHDIKLTVVVDATFGHRIDDSERPEFDAGIVNGELVTPPAGAIGRGDAFILQIADKTGAAVFSNDSFQEFHGIYEWLFDEGRLVGGKPVPAVGWVFVLRTPVRGLYQAGSGTHGGGGVTGIPGRNVVRQVLIDRRRQHRLARLARRAPWPSRRTRLLTRSPVGRDSG